MKNLNALLLAALTFTAIPSFSQTTINFKYTGKTEIWIVPKGVTSITVDLAGGSGGDAQDGIGGKGGRVQCILPVTPGDTLHINVGGKGKDGDNETGRIMGGFNGGGTGYDDENSWSGAGGGGASDIRISPYTFKKRIVVAGGGGGGGVDGCSSSSFLNGGDGGDLIGADGQLAQGGGCDGSGFGGGQTKGGKKGEYTLNPCENRSSNGSLGMGGHGYGWCDNMDQGGSGGGGGWYGGGGGNFGAGGGGSSYTISDAKKVEHTQGYNLGDGYVNIIYTPVDCKTPEQALPVVGKEKINKGETVTFSISPVKGATSYMWVMPDGAEIVSGDGTTSVTVKFGDEAGMISVSCVNDCGTGVARTKMITIQELPKEVTAILGASPEKVCKGTLSVLTASASGGTAPYIYVWMPGNLKGSSVKVYPTATTTYFLTVKDAEGKTFTETVVVNVHQMDITVKTEKDTICSGTSVQLTATGGVKYHWYPETGLSCINCENPVATLNATAEYLVTITDENGCTTTAKVKVVVKTCSTINEVNVTGITVYPVPFKDEFFVSGLVAPENEITVINSLGEVIVTKTVGPGKCTIQTGKIPSGVYYVQVKTKAGMVKKKVVKE